MNLEELCEPLFQEICRMSRLARKGGGAGSDLGQEAARIRSIFATMRADAASDVALSGQYADLERPLVYFVDFMISESALPWARQWPWLEEEMYQELVGQEQFFVLLDRSLSDSSSAATERLAIYFKCLGMGFTGVYRDAPEYLRKKMAEIQARLRERVEVEPARMVPDGELHVDTRKLYEPPSPKLVLMGIALVGLLVVLFVGGFFLYKGRESEIGEHLDRIVAPAE